MKNIEKLNLVEIKKLKKILRKNKILVQLCYVFSEIVCKVRT